MARKQSPKASDRPANLPPDQAAKLLRTQYEKGKVLLDNRPIASADENSWNIVTCDVLESAFGSASPNLRSFKAVTFPGLGGGNEKTWEEDRARDTGERLKILEGLIELLESKAQITAQNTNAKAEPTFGNKVFLVHGHDEAALHETARFLQSLDLEVIVLREQPNKGRTIIEKFIDYSDAGFAVVLLTGDDRGGTTAGSYEDQKPRARQNVILELGFFLGKLGRMRVCALHKQGVEIPSDYSGVLFVPIDSGAWKLALAKEMKAAGLSIDMNKAV